MDVILSHSFAASVCRIVRLSACRTRCVGPLCAAIACIPKDQTRADQQGRQDDQPRFRAERAAGPHLWTLNLNPCQWINVEAADGESEHYALEKIPADVQADG